MNILKQIVIKASFATTALIVVGLTELPANADNHQSQKCTYENNRTVCTTSGSSSTRSSSSSSSSRTTTNVNPANVGGRSQKCTYENNRTVCSTSGSSSTRSNSSSSSSRTTTNVDISEKDVENLFRGIFNNRNR